MTDPTSFRERAMEQARGYPHLRRVGLDLFDEIAAELEKAGLKPEVHLYAEGSEAVVVGRK